MHGAEAEWVNTCFRYYVDVGVPWLNKAIIIIIIITQKGITRNSMTQIDIT